MKEHCTMSDLCIDYLTKNNFKIYIRRAADGCVNEWDWIARRIDLRLYAIDPLSLVGLYMIHEDWLKKFKNYDMVETDQGMVRRGYIADAGNTEIPAGDKLVQWGYKVSMADDSAEYADGGVMWVAEKGEDTYMASGRVRLLGFVTMIQEYGERWEESDVVRSFSIQPRPVEEEI